MNRNKPKTERKTNRTMNKYERMEWFDFIADSMSDTCDLLGIELPAIGFYNECLATKTTIAAYSPDDWTIYVNPDYCVEEAKGAILYAVAHELRHVWQNEYQPNMVSQYKVRESMTSLKKYNSQEAEVDAHAFGLWFILGKTDDEEVIKNYLDLLVKAGCDKKAILDRLSKVIDEMAKRAKNNEKIGDYDYE